MSDEPDAMCYLSLIYWDRRKQWVLWPRTAVVARGRCRVLLYSKCQRLKGDKTINLPKWIQYNKKIPQKNRALLRSSKGHIFTWWRTWFFRYFQVDNVLSPSRAVARETAIEILDLECALHHVTGVQISNKNALIHPPSWICLRSGNLNLPRFAFINRPFWIVNEASICWLRKYRSMAFYV